MTEFLPSIRRELHPKTVELLRRIRERNRKKIVVEQTEEEEKRLRKRLEEWKDVLPSSAIDVSKGVGTSPQKEGTCKCCKGYGVSSQGDTCYPCSGSGREGERYKRLHDI
jgi:hypothetical protein